LLILTLVLVYSVMAPLITPFGIFYFVMDYIITRYNLIYANLVRPRFVHARTHTSERC
jgi:hypothetical protein